MAKGFIKYKSYVFLDKDPVIDVLRTMKARVGMRDSQISDASGVSTAAIRGWFGGDTRRPQFATVAAAAAAMGATHLPLTSSGRATMKKR